MFVKCLSSNCGISLCHVCLSFWRYNNGPLILDSHSVAHDNENIFPLDFVAYQCFQNLVSAHKMQREQHKQTFKLRSPSADFIKNISCLKHTRFESNNIVPGAHRLHQQQTFPTFHARPPTKVGNQPRAIAPPNFQKHINCQVQHCPSPIKNISWLGPGSMRLCPLTNIRKDHAAGALTNILRIGGQFLPIEKLLVFQNYHFLKSIEANTRKNSDKCFINSINANYFCSGKTHLSFSQLKTHLSSYYKEWQTLIFGTILFTS